LSTTIEATILTKIPETKIGTRIKTKKAVYSHTLENLSKLSN
jgi:hypothetical protein